jgi:hypothetical protein
LAFPGFPSNGGAGVSVTAGVSEALGVAVFEGTTVAVLLGVAVVVAVFEGVGVTLGVRCGIELVAVALGVLFLPVTGMSSSFAIQNLTTLSSWLWLPQNSTQLGAVPGSLMSLTPGGGPPASTVRTGCAVIWPKKKAKTIRTTTISLEKRFLNIVYALLRQWSKGERPWVIECVYPLSFSVIDFH